MRLRHGVAACATVGLVLSGVTARAQGAAMSPAADAPGTMLTDSVSPFGATAMTADERGKITDPELSYVATPEDEKNFEKYYHFYRPGTDFGTAFADVSECDGYARGLRSSLGSQTVYTPYAGTMAGALGGALGSAMAQAIFGSAEKRRLRRVNMRTCMNYKGYGRYGLSKDVWKGFNFEEGMGSVDDADRRRMLAQQAIAASARQPATKELGL